MTSLESAFTGIVDIVQQAKFNPNIFLFTVDNPPVGDQGKGNLYHDAKLTLNRLYSLFQEDGYIRNLIVANGRYYYGPSKPPGQTGENDGLKDFIVKSSFKSGVDVSKITTIDGLLSPDVMENPVEPGKFEALVDLLKEISPDMVTTAEFELAKWKSDPTSYISSDIIDVKTMEAAAAADNASKPPMEPPFAIIVKYTGNKSLGITGYTRQDFIDAFYDGFNNFSITVVERGNPRNVDRL